jgi:hypothetical protein
MEPFLEVANEGLNARAIGELSAPHQRLDVLKEHRIEILELTKCFKEVGQDRTGLL